MSLAPPGYVDRSGQPFAAHIQEVLRDLLPRLQREYAALRDEATFTAVLEEAGRKIARAERRQELRDLHRYAWVVVRSVAISRTRTLRVSQSMLELADSTDILASTPATMMGTAESIEREILLREIMEMLEPDEQSLMILKTAGFSSPEIGVELGISKEAVDTRFSRVRAKVRHQMSARGVAAHTAEEDGEGANE